MAKYPIKGFPYTVEAENGKEVSTTREGLQFMVYAMLQLDHIFEQNKSIKIRGKNDK